MRCCIRNVFLFAGPELLKTIKCPSQIFDTPQRLTFLLSSILNKSTFVIPCPSPSPIPIPNRSTSHHARLVHSRSSCVILCSSRSSSHTQDQYATAFEAIAVGPKPTIFSPTQSQFPFFLKNTDAPFSSSSSSPLKPDPTPNCDLLTTRSQKRRRPSCSTDLKRRSKKGDHNYVKRLENAFILFRSKCHEYRQKVQVEWVNEPGKKQCQADLSKAVCQQWMSLTSEEHHYWQELAKEKKKEHEEMYPDYVYRPRRSKDKTGRLEKKKSKGVRGKYEHDTVMSSHTPMLHHSNGPFGLNLLLVHQDLCQGSSFEASLQVSQSLYLSSPSMLIEISRPTNPLPTRIPPKMSPQTGTLPPFHPLIRCLTNSCFKQNQCSSRNPRQYRDSHYHFPQPTSSRPPTLCSVCRILSAARTSGTPLRSKHKWQGREQRFRCRTPYHCLFPGNTYMGKR